MRVLLDGVKCAAVVAPVGRQEIGCLCDRMSKCRNVADIAKLDQDRAIAKYVLFENRSA